jgi:hypothetical protein
MATRRANDAVIHVHRLLIARSCVPGKCKSSARRRTLSAYTTLIRELGDTDLTTQHLLGGLLVATEKQASELAGYLKRSADTRP